jgi:hypothetical protein
MNNLAFINAIRNKTLPPEEFEAQMPDAHQQFLQSLGISDAEITQIRAWSRAPSEAKY